MSENSVFPGDKIASIEDKKLNEENIDTPPHI